MEVQYYSLGMSGGHTLARVYDDEYAYLDTDTGHWIVHAPLFTRVEFEPSTRELTLEEAKDWVKRKNPQLNMNWIDIK